MTRPIDIPAQSLITTARELLEKDGRHLEIIARESGLPTTWLRGFKYNGHQTASVNHVQVLIEFLTGRPLL